MGTQTAPYTSGVTCVGTPFEALCAHSKMVLMCASSTADCLNFAPFLPFSSHSNLLTLRLRSLHSLPESWQPPNFPYTFSLAMPLPSSSSPTTIILPQGVLKCSPDKDPSVLSSHWRWPNLPGAVGGAALDLGRPIQPCALEDEVGELNEKQVRKELTLYLSSSFPCSFTPPSLSFSPSFLSSFTFLSLLLFLLPPLSLSLSPSSPLSPSACKVQEVSRV